MCCSVDPLRKTADDGDALFCQRFRQSISGITAVLGGAARADDRERRFIGIDQCAPHIQHRRRIRNGFQQLGVGDIRQRDKVRTGLAHPRQFGIQIQPSARGEELAQHLLRQTCCAQRSFRCRPCLRQ